MPKLGIYKFSSLWTKSAEKLSSAYEMGVLICLLTRTKQFIFSFV